MRPTQECAPKDDDCPDSAAKGVPARLEDPAVIQGVQEYLAALEAGGRPDRQKFLDRYAGIAAPLAECLDALEFMRMAAPQMQPAVDSQPCSVTVSTRTPLGDFRIIREIGRGGMGVVYEAEQVSLGRRVAVKVLPFTATLDPKQLQRFKNEAQAAAHLRHPNIVPVYYFGCERGVHFYAMQYIEGQNLAALIRELRLLSGLRVAEEEHSAGSVLALASELVSGHWAPSQPSPTNGPPTGPYSPGSAGLDSPAPATSSQAAALSTERSTKNPSYFRTVASLGMQAADALEFAHELGVVHRDIKPANLLVDAHGQLWITDFGLAHCQGNPGLTMTGDVVGTLRYMSPEQALAKRGQVDHHTDIYSLGVTLYELLTLEPAFASHDRQELLQQIAVEEPRLPRRLNEAIPFELETIVLKAIAKSPAERYATAQELADDLKRYLEDKPIRARRPTLLERASKWSRRHRLVVATAAVLLVMVVIGMAVSTGLIWREQARAETRSRQARRAVDEMYSEVAEEWLDQEPHMEEVQRRFLLKALEFYEEFATQEGRAPAVQLAQTTAYRRVGDLQEKLGEHVKAGDAYGRALTLSRQLVEDFPAEPEYRALLAGCLHRLGLHFSRGKQFEEAERAYREAVALREKLVAESPNCPECQYDLAASFSDLGRVHHSRGRPQEAEPAYRRALDLLNKLAAQRPGESRYQDQLGATLNNLAELLGGRGNSTRDRQLLEQAIHHQEAAVQARPRHALYRTHLGNQLTRLGRTLMRLGDYAEAEKAYRQAISIREKLAEDFAKVPDQQRELAGNCNELGNLLDMTGQDAEAEKVYRRTLAVREKLKDDFPEDARNRRDLSWFLSTCPAPQLRNPDRAVSLAKEAVELAPEGGDCWRTLGVARYRASDWKGAVAALKKATELRSGGDSTELFFLAMAYWQLGDKQQARSSYDRAMRWMDENQPRDEKLRRWRAEAAALLGVTDKPMAKEKDSPSQED
jgi:serine/threonine protein kinase/Flp pilus assembly protein TadD